MSRCAPAWLSFTLVVVLLLQAALPVFAPHSASAAAEASPSATVAPEPASRVLLAPTVVNVPTVPLAQTVAFPPAVALTTILPVTTTAASAAPLELNLRLSLGVDPPWAAPGEAVTFTVVAMNLAEAVLPALVITDTLPNGLLYIAQSGQGFAYDADTQLLAWPAGDLAAGTAITGSFQARVQDLASGVMLTNTVTATSPASTAAVTATVMLEVAVPRSNEAWVTPETGGLLRSADDRLLLRAPPGAVEGRTRIRYTPRPDLEELPSYILAPFAMEAQDENGQPVREFAAPLTLRLALTPTPNSSTILSEPGLFALDEASGQWLALPSDANSGTNCLNATLTHFSIYSEGDITYIVERMASLRGAQTNLFTRSIGYGYGFELPPGRGGLTPMLGLSYSSSNHTPNSGHFSLAGYGWQLAGADAVYIAPGDANRDKPTLSLQGATYSLRRTEYDGQQSAWFAKENPFLKITTLNESHGTAGTWYVWTPDGTRFTFDATTAASEYYWKLCGTTVEDRRYVRVPLVSITDSQGNTVSYTWENEEDGTGPEDCPHHFRGARLKTISYNGGTLQVSLGYTERLDRPDGYDSASWRFYTTQKLSTVTIQVQDGGVGAWRTVRRYVLGHNPQDETAAVSQKVLNLDWLEEQAADAMAWPRLTFDYTADWFSTPSGFGALTWVRNGFGGEVSFATASRMSGQPLIVTTRTEKDLITATAPVTWTYTSNAWLEGGTSNGETLVSGYDEVDITDPGGGVTKRFFHVTDAVTGGQIDARAGRERLTEVWSGGAKLHWTVTTWISDTTSLPVAGVHPLSNEALKPRFVYTGSTETYETGGQRVLRIENYYQTSRQGASGEQFGNLTEQRVIAGAATGWWASEPLRTRYTWYYPNTAAWIINRPAQVQLYRACIGCPNAAHETTSLYYYDNATSETTPPTAGQLTQQCAGVGAEQITTATYEYWPNGNVKRITDGRGHATRTLYDSAFQVYPVCVVNALGHVTLTRYYGVPGLAAGDVGTGVDQCPQQPGAGDAAWDGAGVPVSGRFFGQTQTVTDPNGAATTCGYDALGRLTSASWAPDAAPTRVYEYRPFSQVDTNQPFWVRTRQKDSAAPAGSSNADYANTYAYYDGFG